MRSVCAAAAQIVIRTFSVTPLIYLGARTARQLSPTPARACAAAGHTPQQKRLWKLFAAAFAILILLIGFVAGFFTAKHVGSELMTRCYSKAGRDGSSTQGAQLLNFTRGMPVDGLALRELPPPWSEEAQQMQATPGTPGGLFALLTVNM